MIIREAQPSDAPAIAALQIASWRSAYRGILSDAYLGGPIEAERRELWRARLSERVGPDQIIILAEEGGQLIGLACILAGYDPHWGSLIDNLHVAPDRKRSGVGREILRVAATRIAPDHARVPVHLTVFEENEAARYAYESWGGTVVERLEARQPDGGEYPVRRYSWQSPAQLLSRLGSVTLERKEPGNAGLLVREKSGSA